MTNTQTEITATFADLLHLAQRLGAEDYTSELWSLRRLPVVEQLERLQAIHRDLGEWADDLRRAGLLPAHL